MNTPLFLVRFRAEEQHKNFMGSNREMVKKIYVGNLPFRAYEEEVRELFAQYGEVYSVDLITDRETGRPRGFAFVEMEGARPRD